jgi:hypothetical protein
MAVFAGNWLIIFRVLEAAEMRNVCGWLTETLAAR